MDEEIPKGPLRRGWTTGACAAGAAKAAFAALMGDSFPDPVAVRLPRGQLPAFALAMTERGSGFARAGIVKDAGDDPDVTHGALVVATVRRGAPGTGIALRAGPGVGTATRPGLPIPPGEPAINPVPRRLIAEGIAEIAAQHGAASDAEVEISVPGGEALAAGTLNGRLGIVGGLSILGTTGIVVPYSCAAWIDTIHRGIDVARAMGLDHVAGATGASSEDAIRARHALTDAALIDMGDFVGGMLKYLRRHPVARISVAGGFAKMTKLGQGLLDLHSRRGAVDTGWLAAGAARAGAPPGLVDAIAASASGGEALHHARAAGFELGGFVAEAAWASAAKALGAAPSALEVAIFDRDGRLLASTGFRPVH